MKINKILEFHTRTTKIKKNHRIQINNFENEHKKKNRNYKFNKTQSYIFKINKL